jgi:hypothetical protein
MQVFKRNIRKSVEIYLSSGLIFLNYKVRIVFNHCFSNQEDNYTLFTVHEIN